ncbi:hypothetical protein E3T34_05110 [Cryobacterium sp. TMT1-62]|nr:hypothetical protein E3T34_05110 [Cryobacterium sp. TMT1-62]
MPPANRRKAGVVRLIGICGLGGGLAFLLIGGLGLVVSITVFESLPGYPDIEPLSQKSNTYAAQNDGTSVLLASFYDQNRIEVDWDEISPYARDAVIAATPAREIKKMRLAIGAEKKFPQNDILRQYLNITGFGGTVYGNEAAANYYFGTTAAELTLPQAASLVEIVDNPAKFRLDNPGSETNGYPVNKARRDYILREMVEHEKITAAEFQAAVATPVQPAIQGTFNDSCRGPQNYDFQIWNPRNDAGESGGNSSALESTLGSINTGFIGMAKKLDLCGILQTAAAFGVHRADGSPLVQTAAAVIGTNEVAPLTMAGAFAGMVYATRRVMTDNTAARRTIPTTRRFRNRNR